MKANTITYFYWSDIKEEICDVMGIKEEVFRDYHGHDLWLYYICYFDNDVKRDNILEYDLINSEDLSYKLQQAKSRNEEWAYPFIRAVYKVFEKYNIQYIKY